MNKLKVLLLALMAMLGTSIAAWADTGTQYDDNGNAIFNWSTTYNNLRGGEYRHYLTVTSLVPHLRLRRVGCNNSNADGWIDINGYRGSYTIHSDDYTYGQHWYWNASW